MNSSLIPHRQLIRVLVPSSVGGVLTLILAVAMVVAIMTPQFTQMGDVELYSDYLKKNPSDLYERSERASQIVNSSPIAADISVFVVWGLTGLIGYSLIMGLMHLGRTVLQLIRDIEYSRTEKMTIQREALLHLFVRLIAVFFIFFYYLLFMNIILPVVVVITQAVLGSGALEASAYFLLAILITALSVHIMVVLTRFVLLRTRVFFDRDYIPS